MLNQSSSWLTILLLSLAFVGYPSVTFAVVKEESSKKQSSNTIKTTNTKAKVQSDKSVKAKKALDKKHPDYVRAVLIAKITPYIYWQPNMFNTTKSSIMVFGYV